MVSAGTDARAASIVEAGSLASRRRQLFAVLRLEIRRVALRARTLPLYFAAAAPVGLALLVALVFSLLPPEAAAQAIPQIPGVYAALFVFLLRFCLFAGCLWLFMNLFRGEMIDRSLHFYFLAPVRRELLVVGKFLAGFVVASSCFVCSTLLSFVILHAPFGNPVASGEILGGTMGSRLAGFAFTTVLACLGYGALFLALGVFVRNPIIPGFFIWLWEQVNQFLPASVKPFSVVYWLQSVHVVEIGEGEFATVGRLVSPWISTPGLLAVASVLVAVAAWRTRRIEIDYSAE
jgi:hypothetical protein